ncbi:MAG: twin-arginine translocase TatA/TatE family subunit [Calditrichaeota bacterium]|jgi:sec-independent protein translocase protein TatA|nr:twin-arginine translocase TatA/TatE family subunit [Calditrichota bacterium]MBT7616494.1 twin-arginine translocase TatA/TatE family subunit [Calditrichota bacterium]MBT7788007.1 twin-arginine translocase TatA/TatE family subunit [Calditrichota bacterium]
MHFGPVEIGLIVVIVLILFGAKRIPELMKGFGTGIREFKSGLREDESVNSADTNNNNDIKS